MQNSINWDDLEKSMTPGATVKSSKIDDLVHCLKKASEIFTDLKYTKESEVLNLVCNKINGMK